MLSIPADQVRVRLASPIAKKQFASPARGLWIPIPPEFRTWGTTPALHFVDDLMRHMDRHYYIGWLSAAELLGAAHQRPQVFQVAVDARMRERQLDRVRIEFLTRPQLTTLPTRVHETPTGTAIVASPELTAFDLVDQPRHGGGLSNVATVLAELAEDPGFDPAELRSTAEHFSTAISRRLGYLLTAVNSDVDIEGLHRYQSDANHATPTLLAKAGPRHGKHDLMWNIVVNTELDPDL